MRQAASEPGQSPVAAENNQTVIEPRPNGRARRSNTHGMNEITNLFAGRLHDLLEGQFQLFS